MNCHVDVPKLHDCRDAFSQTLIDLAQKNPDIVVVCNDSVGSSKLSNFASKWPERLINVGIAEQNMVGIGSGLSNGGKLPFVCAASCFLTGRALEQIKVDIAYSQVNVKLVGMSSGVAYGELGPTHHSIEDFAWTRVISDLPVIAPADRVETASVLKWASEVNGPCFLRLSRIGVPDIFSDDYVFELGKANVLHSGTDLTIISNGTLSHRAIEAATILKKSNVSARVINMATVCPIDSDLIEKVARETGAILTCEEHSIHGGLGSAVAEVIVESQPVPMKILGFPGIFAPTGSANFLLDRYGMSPNGIAKYAIELMKRKFESR